MGTIVDPNWRSKPKVYQDEVFLDDLLPASFDSRE